MRLKYSDVRRATIGALNRGKQLSQMVVERMRIAALNRAPFSEATKQLISMKSANVGLYRVSFFDGSLLPNNELFITIRTIPAVADYIRCSEKTVRRALKSNGIVKNKWLVSSSPVSAVKTKSSMLN
uniref:Uncharacterized protein n=1 Tax=Microbotryum cf. violaceum BFL-2013 TaxID=1288119 RepID=M1GMG4_9BASI|nr:hypothetical protein H888_mgp34 [Microbotryum cf. violaceum BFL-2013]AGE14624.1 hypothetical protein [Microbotryum cf. violaceum BFL-2013]